jgi:hypothetical protein
MRRHVLLACVTVALAGVPAFPSIARADDAAVAEAKARFEEGLELADAGKHEPARLKFQQAWAVFKSPAVLYNLARSEQLTGHDLEALEHFRLFAKVSATDVKITDAMREKAKQNATELATKVGQVDIDVPPAARVSVDGKALEETPKEPVPVAPGRHRIEASFEGKLKAVTVECAAGAVVKAKIDFDAGGTTEPPPVEPDRPFWTTGRIVGVSLGVAGLAGIGTGIGFALRAGSKSDDAASKRATLPDSQSSCSTNPDLPECGDLKTLQHDYKTASALRTVFISSGAALLVGGTVLFLASSPKKGDPPSVGKKMRVIPVASSKEAGLAWFGTF